MVLGAIPGTINFRKRTFLNSFWSEWFGIVLGSKFRYTGTYSTDNNWLECVWFLGMVKALSLVGLDQHQQVSA